jgi:hypothetical protein
LSFLATSLDRLLIAVLFVFERLHVTPSAVTGAIHADDVPYLPDRRKSLVRLPKLVC